MPPIVNVSVLHKSHAKLHERKDRNPSLSRRRNQKTENR